VKAALEEKTKEIDRLVREAQAARTAITRQKLDNEKEEAKYTELQNEMVEIIREGQQNHKRLEAQIAWYQKFNQQLTRPVEEIRAELRRRSVVLVGTAQPAFEHGITTAPS
jgi:uncharacterized protein YlxW (UPF0749 family)